MPLLMIIPVAILNIWIAIYTLSYAVWNWKNKNKTGSLAVAIIGIASVALPAYIAFIRV